MYTNNKFLNIAAALLLLCGTSHVFAAELLESLSAADQDEISKLCLPVQYREGSVAYRNCVQTEISQRSGQADSEIAKLSFDDKYAVQQACANAGGSSAADYQNCANQQMADLQRLPVPNFNGVNEDELYTIQQSCFDAQSTKGAGAYRTCLNGQLNELQRTPSVDTSNLSMLNKNALQLRCSANSDSAASYRQCLAAEFESIVGTAPVLIPAQKTVPQQIAVVSNTPIGAPAAANAVTPIANSLPRNIEPQRQQVADLAPTGNANAAVTSTTNNAATIAATAAADGAASNITQTITDTERVISRPGLVATLEEKAKQELREQNGTSAQTDVSGASNSTDSLLNQAKTWFNDAKTKVMSGDREGWPLIAAIVALPLLLLGLWAALRSPSRSNRESPYAQTENPYDAGQYENAERLRQQAEEAQKLFGDDTRTDQSAEQPPSPSDVTEFIIKTKTDANSNPQSQNSIRALLPESDLEHWLKNEPLEYRQQHCIEFLLYWMAYGDERYEPKLKQRLFSTDSLNEHDQIKRWVLEKDTAAFAHVVNQLRTQSSNEQLQQILSLLSALLISENAVTPVQNTLLRFLADAFNIGKEQLEEQFMQSFGHELPPVPRTDRISWWRRQTDQSMQRWDSRFLATRSVPEQMIARLGLDEQFEESDVIAAFRRASKRCHPNRFNGLGQQERALAERQFVKFEEARDKLLGVTV